MQPKSMTRRYFMQSIAAGAAGVASMGVLAGCSPSTATEAPAEDETASMVTGRVMGYSGPGDWLGTAPVINDSDISATIDADFVVVGSGNAGVEAAWAAAEAGLKVSVIETMSKDAYTVFGGEMGIWNSKYMMDRYSLIEYDLGEVTDEFVRRSIGRVNPDILRKYVQSSGEMFDHLTDFLTSTDEGKAILTDDVFFIHEQRDPETGEALARDKYPIVRGGWKTWCSDAQFQGEISHEAIDGVASRSKLPALNKMIIAQAETIGATWYYENTAVVLVQDASGAVTGVIAQDKDDKYVKYTASKGVLVATGDYSGNAEMCWALEAENMEWAERQGITAADFKGMFGRNGYGHKMCCWAGGLLEPSPRPMMVIGSGAGGPWGMAPFYWCNSKGERFCNEASAQTAYGTCARQPFGLMCTVTDTKWMTSMSLAGIEHGGPNYGRPVYYTEMQEDMDKVLAAGKDGYAVRSCTVIERNPSTVYGANTLEELAEILGYTGDTRQSFLDSIARYNELCKAGKDTDYGKDAECMLAIDEGPFYGVISSNEGSASIGLVSLAGLVTDINFNVLDINNNPIKGLYVAGNTLGGRYGTAYSTPTGGNSVGMARTHGRLIGQIMATL